MARVPLVTDASDIAGTIVRLPAEELAKFVAASIRQRSLHQVVANLNEDVLSKALPRSSEARKALHLLGFAD